MNSPDIAINNATIINEGSCKTGSVLIKNGRIYDILFDPKDFIYGTIHTIDASGKFLIPGVIDDQVHFRDPGLTFKGSIYSESAAAVAGGITSFMDMPNTVPQTLSIDLVKEKLHIASMNSVANYSFYLGASMDNISEIASADPQLICGVKVFMGSSTGNMLVNDPKTLEQIFKLSPLIIATHCEDDTIINRNLNAAKLKYGDNIPFEIHPVIRSEEACYASSSLAVELASKYDVRLHLLHLSTAKELKLLSAKTGNDDKKITAEVCVHHLWFSDEDYNRLGARIKWNPAVKSAKDREALLDAVNNGLIDIIATDHAPHTLEEKSKSYFHCPSGGPLVQHSLVAMMELYLDHKISLTTIVDKMCHSPARIFNIRDRGFIRINYMADLVLIDPSSPWTVESDNILYHCGWSPFEGTQFHSQVTHTFVNGQLVYNNGVVDRSIRGQQITFNR
ncbi:MAG: dihydroorotase [Bacteroidota bacterium]